MKVGRGAPAYGEIVTQFADLEQGIANLVLTPIRSVPTEPEKGCDLIPYMDLPPLVAVPKLMVTIWEGLKRWHPRILVDRVEVLPVNDAERGFSHFRCPVFWRPVQGVVQDLLQTDVDVSRERLGLAVLA